MLHPSLQKLIEMEYDLPMIEKSSQLTGGYECDVWRVTVADADYVVRMTPKWRTRDNLRRIYQYVNHVAKFVSEAIAPIPTKAREPFCAYQGRGIFLFPYVAGEILDRDNPNLIRHSAEILAKIHLASLDLPADITQNAPHAPYIEAQPNEPKSVYDPELDQWHQEFSHHDDHIVGMMHGDYYRGNILCHYNAVQGVIDWDECYHGTIVREVAWSTWEMCHIGDDLDIEKATSFLGAYMQVDSRLAQLNFDAIIPLIRYHLRYEIRRSIAMERAGHDWDNDYREQEIRAFNNLRNMTFSI